MYQLNLPKGQWDECVNRNRLFYCAHQNRGNAFFRKHMINSPDATCEELAAKIYAEQLGFTRIRRSLQESVRRILETAVANIKAFNFTYYLQKNAPLPPNWKTRKAELLVLADDPATRGAVFSELFERSNSSN